MLGQISLDLHDAYQAIQYNERCLTIQSKVSSKEELARSLYQLGQNYLVINRNEEARMALEKALAMQVND